MTSFSRALLLLFAFAFPAAVGSYAQYSQPGSRTISTNSLQSHHLKLPKELPKGGLNGMAHARFGLTGFDSELLRCKVNYWECAGILPQPSPEVGPNGVDDND
jgi:hypothetical protein